jgi:hypothetical protein
MLEPDDFFEIARPGLVELRHTRTTMAKVNPEVKMVNTHTYRFRAGDGLFAGW